MSLHVCVKSKVEMGKVLAFLTCDAKVMGSNPLTCVSFKFSIYALPWKPETWVHRSKGEDIMCVAADAF